MWDMTSLTVTDDAPLEDELEVVSEAARLLKEVSARPTANVSLQSKRMREGMI
jgi:hypothetical protein